MKLIKRKANLLAVFVLFSTTLFAQVKIGGNPKENPDPSAVLDLQSTDKGLLLPRLTAQQIQAIKNPANALVVYNKDENAIFIYSDVQKQWMPLMLPTAARLGGDSCEWVFDTTTARVFLARGYPIGDSIFYNIARRKFVFADKVQSSNGIPADEFYPGKYIFKGSASGIVTDTGTLNFPSLTLSNFLYEIDNDSFAIANPNIAFYNGMRVSTQMLPTATQKASTIRSLLLQVNNTASDTVFATTALASNAFIDGTGFTSSFNGFQNNMSVSPVATGNIGSITGYRNTIGMSSNNGNRVLGNVFGYFGSIGGFIDSLGNRLVNGNAYGIFLNSINAANSGRNFGFYSSKGHNRLGDSTLITDGTAINPRAVFDINATSAMITPSGTTLQRPGTPVTAMLRNNTDTRAMEYFDGLIWRSLSSDSTEWKFDGVNKVNLVRGLPLSDTIFYKTNSRQFVFSDRNTNTNSLGQDFPIENFAAKFTFKSTASQRTDSLIANGATMNINYEVDNATQSTLYTALSTSAVVNPKAFQKSDQVLGIGNTVIHAGNDSVQGVIGISNVARNSGNGKSGFITGMQNSVRIFNGNANNTGELTGIRNIIGRSGTTAGRVTGNVYGMFTTFTGLANNVDGNVYGVFLGSVTGGTARRNFAYYSNKGLNRLGDSVLVTDGAAITPRAVLDVNATSAMIVPTGTTSQRPATAVAGMVRYNTDNGGRLETHNGAAWSGIVSGGIGIDPPNILSGSGVTASFAFSGATIGSVVCISPVTAPPAGIIIAWARVSAANTIEVRFENNSGAAVNPPSIAYNIRVIQ